MNFAPINSKLTSTTTDNSSAAKIKKHYIGLLFDKKPILISFLNQVAELKDLTEVTILIKVVLNYIASGSSQETKCSKQLHLDIYNLTANRSPTGLFKIGGKNIVASAVYCLTALAIKYSSLSKNGISVFEGFSSDVLTGFVTSTLDRFLQENEVIPANQNHQQHSYFSDSEPRADTIALGTMNEADFTGCTVNKGVLQIDNYPYHINIDFGLAQPPKKLNDGAPTAEEISAETPTDHLIL